MSQTKIEWADKVWNPITGCSPVSEGCLNCYAKRMANRLKGRYGYPKDDPFRVTFHPDRLEEPLHWKKPCRVFVCSMGDLFHDRVERDDRARAFRSMMANSQHTYFMLTKRPQNIPIYEWFQGRENWWFGVSIEDQKTADERIPILLQIPAAHRFVSVEPMLGPMDLGEWLGVRRYTTLDGLPEKPYWKRLIGTPLFGILDWVICGGETGPKARPLHPDWVRSLSDQCQAAGVPFFFKGWGEWTRDAFIPTDYLRGTKGGNDPRYDSKFIMMRVGKKKAGRFLDGKIWEEIPDGKRDPPRDSSPIDVYLQAPLQGER